MSGIGSRLQRPQVIISNLDPGVNSEDLRRLFDKFDVRSVDLHYDGQGRSLCTASAIFADEEEALRSVNHFRGSHLDGKLLHMLFVDTGDVGSPKRKAPRSSSPRIAVNYSTNGERGCSDAFIDSRQDSSRGFAPMPASSDRLPAWGPPSAALQPVPPLPSFNVPPPSFTVPPPPFPSITSAAAIPWPTQPPAAGNIAPYVPYRANEPSTFCSPPPNMNNKNCADFNNNGSLKPAQQQQQVSWLLHEPCSNQPQPWNNQNDRSWNDNRNDQSNWRSPAGDGQVPQCYAGGRPEKSRWDRRGRWNSGSGSSRGVSRDVESPPRRTIRNDSHHTKRWALEERRGRNEEGRERGRDYRDGDREERMKRVPTGKGGFTWATPRNAKEDGSNEAETQNGRTITFDKTLEISDRAINWRKNVETKYGKISNRQLKRAAIAEKKRKGFNQQRDNAKRKMAKKMPPCKEVDPEEAEKKSSRGRRFALHRGDAEAKTPMQPYRPSASKIIVGTNQEVEKQYLRLTSDPDPATVRPLEVLVKSLDLIKQKHEQGADYRYLSDQLKSVRQDLIVQGIQDKFTVLVYEINARICLENKDREEFNQCQSQLKLLYHKVEGCPAEAEFTAYRLLYYIAMDNNQDITTLLRGIRREMRDDECMAYALKVRQKLSINDQVGFFALYKRAPNMCACILDMLLERERRNAMNAFVRAYRPSLSLSLIADWLVMKEEELCAWLKENGVNEATVGGVIDCKTHANLFKQI